MRGEVRRLIEEALSLPEMPGYVNYEPLQRDIQQWIEALRGAVADVDAAREVGGRGCRITGGGVLCRDDDAGLVLPRL